MNGIYELIPDGEFTDGTHAFRLRNLNSFTIHGQTIKAGEETLARFDGNCDVVHSWVWGPGEFRNVQLQWAIIGREALEPSLLNSHHVNNSRLSSCVIKCDQMITFRVDLNAVNTKRIKFFGALGSEDGLRLSHLNYSLSVRMYNTSYAEFREYIKKVQYCEPT